MTCCQVTGRIILAQAIGGNVPWLVGQPWGNPNAIVFKQKLLNYWAWQVAAPSRMDQHLSMPRFGVDA